MSINDKEKLKELFKRSCLRNYFTPLTPKNSRFKQLNLTKILRKNREIQNTNFINISNQIPNPSSISNTPEKQRFFIQLSTRILNFPENNSKKFNEYNRNSTNTNYQQLHRMIPVNVTQIDSSQNSRLNYRIRKNQNKANSTGNNKFRNSRNGSEFKSGSKGAAKNYSNEIEEANIKAWEYDTLGNGSFDIKNI